MKIRLFLLFFTLCGAAVGLTQSEVEKVEVSLLHMLGKSANNEALVLRLLFHDCVGGCDGCVNITRAENKGLNKIVDDLEKVFRLFRNRVSRADVWALAGKVAVESATRRSASRRGEKVKFPVIEFKYGRKDCSSFHKSGQQRNLADIDLNSTGLTDYFKKEFDFTAEETVAIMGAHTLGGAHTKISRRSGLWVNNGADEFNNKYYSNMKTDNWRQIGDPRFPKEKPKTLQWNGSTGFRLNCDMALFYKNIALKPGERSCAFGGCPLAPTAGTVEKYANSNDAWLDDFGPAFTKMINNKATSLKTIKIKTKKAKGLRTIMFKNPFQWFNNFFFG